MLNYILLAETFWEKPSTFGVPMGVVFLVFWAVWMINQGNKENNSTSSNNSYTIWNAIADGDYSEFKVKLSELSNLNIRDEHGDTPLTDVLRSNKECKYKMITDLMGKGADPNYQMQGDKRLLYPLEMCTYVNNGKYRDLKALDLLLSNGADLNLVEDFILINGDDIAIMKIAQKYDDKVVLNPKSVSTSLPLQIDSDARRVKFHKNYG